ncbi:MAG TPA: preprotein translocase subunit SecG [Candidatus Paceibacterota bacterium]|jgi:protein translocase SecG subunit|nr:preprotein translocase subunit SecG [Candidatus Paceibacterota bacterium]
MLSILEIILAVAIIVLILLQERTSGMSGLLGGDGGGFYQARRGVEKIIFYSTIALIIIFLGLALYQLYIGG